MTDSPGATQVVNTVGVFAVAGLENAMLARGMSLLNVRKYATGAASFGVGISLILFGLAKSAPQATVCYCLLKATECLHSAGMSSNRLEVGGKDIGIMSSVVNVSATLPAYIIPFIGMYIRRATGSWLGIFLVAAALQLASGLVWVNCVSLKTARQLLEEQDGKGK